MQEQETLNAAPFLELFQKFQEKSQKILKNVFHDQPDNIELALDNLSCFYQAFLKKILAKPQTFIETQFKYYEEYIALCENYKPKFSNDPITYNLIFDLINQHHELMAQHAKNLIKNICDEDEYELMRRFNFFTKQWINAFAPYNFIYTNPELLKTTSELGGTNLYLGLKHFLDDLENGKGLLNFTMTDQDFFSVGKNIAITEGKVIYQNELMQLIHYTPVTKNVYQYPLLIIPPWINKYYILDLQPENSLVKWLLEQGFNVFLISWVNPNEQHAHIQFSDYMTQGPLAALNVVQKITGEQKTNALGYCIGGTLLACTLAYLSSKNDDRILSASYLTTLIDFSDPGELGAFIDEEQITLLENYMKKKGYMDGSMMATAFNLLRPKELIWSNFINNYLKGKTPKPFDFLYWNSDPTHVPEKVHSFYLREMYLHNHLIQPGKIRFKNISLDLRKITNPSYFLAAIDDHIVPWATCYKGMQSLINAPKKFVLTKSGHVGGVVNPPQRNKYGYFTHARKPKNPATWLSSAQLNEGSWWIDWASWLKKYSGRKIAAAELTSSSTSHEKAPGSYVKIKAQKITEL